MSGAGNVPPFRFVAIVGSFGALPVLATVVDQLPETFPVPVLVVQHRPAGTNGDTLTMLLRRHTALPVRLGRIGLPAWGPGVTVIPGHESATVADDHRLLLHPATVSDMGGDELLATAAAAAQPGCGIGVILSGMRRDGAAGIRPVKRTGGRVLAQDPATARAPGMPTAALATGCVDFVLPPHRIAPALVALTMAPGGADLLTVPTPHWAALGTG
ncbi:MAG: chemotaxis protein CheB [Actinobacteria bacterium]|nr:chemotaxis protein CheB [Actinomycetota bacterium]